MNRELETRDEIVRDGLSALQAYRNERDDARAEVDRLRLEVAELRGVDKTLRQTVSYLTNRNDKLQAAVNTANAALRQNDASRRDVAQQMQLAIDNVGEDPSVNAMAKRLAPPMRPGNGDDSHTVTVRGAPHDVKPSEADRLVPRGAIT